MSSFGKKVKFLRERSSLLQKDVAQFLSIDAPMLSKIENGERHAKREQIKVLSKIFHVPEEDLLSLWLADKVYEMLKDEDIALEVLSMTGEVIKNQSSN